MRFVALIVHVARDGAAGAASERAQLRTRIDGTVEDERIAFEALVLNPLVRSVKYAATAQVNADVMRLKLRRLLGLASVGSARLRRCVAPPELSEADACSDEALWRQYLERID